MESPMTAPLRILAIILLMSFLSCNNTVPNSLQKAEYSIPGYADTVVIPHTEGELEPGVSYI